MRAKIIDSGGKSWQVPSVNAYTMFHLGDPGLALGQDR